MIFNCKLDAPAVKCVKMVCLDSRVSISAPVYLAAQLQTPATSVAKISVHVLEILQLARSKHTSLCLAEPYPIFKKIFHMVSISLVSV